jgi:hypothetical protein
MLAGIWGLLKGASWAQRGISLGVLAGAFLMAYGLGYYKGYQSSTEDHASAALSQAIDAKEHGAEKEAQLDRLIESHEQVARTAERDHDVITKEIIRYVETTRPIQLDPEYQRLLRELQRLQRDAQNRVSRTDTTTPENPPVQAEGLTASQLLQGYDELTKARNEDLGVIALCQDFEATRYASEYEYYHPK